MSNSQDDQPAADESWDRDAAAVERDAGSDARDLDAAERDQAAAFERRVICVLRE